MNEIVIEISDAYLQGYVQSWQTAWTISLVFMCISTACILSGLFFIYLDKGEFEILLGFVIITSVVLLLSSVVFMENSTTIKEIENDPLFYIENKIRRNL